MAQSDDLRRQIDSLFPDGIPNSHRCEVCDTWMLPAIFTNGQQFAKSDLLICAVCVLRIIPEALGGWLD